MYLLPSLKCILLFFIKSQIFHFESRLICNSKIIQIRLILILCGQTGICQITFLIVPLFQSTVVEHLQIILNDKRNDIVFQALLKHDQSAHTPITIRRYHIETPQENDS